MTTTAITARTRAVPAAAKRPGLPGTLRSELTKILHRSAPPTGRCWPWW